MVTSVSKSFSRPTSLQFRYITIVYNYVFKVDSYLRIFFSYLDILVLSYVFMTHEHPFTHFPSIRHHPHFWRLMHLPIHHSEWEMHQIGILILFILCSEITLPFFRPTLAQTIYEYIELHVSLLLLLVSATTRLHHGVCTLEYKT